MICAAVAGVRRLDLVWLAGALYSGNKTLLIVWCLATTFHRTKCCLAGLSQKMASWNRKCGQSSVHPGGTPQWSLAESLCFHQQLLTYFCNGFISFFNYSAHSVLFYIIFVFIICIICIYFYYYFIQFISHFYFIIIFYIFLLLSLPFPLITNIWDRILNWKKMCMYVNQKISKYHA